MLPSGVPHTMRFECGGNLWFYPRLICFRSFSSSNSQRAIMQRMAYEDKYPLRRIKSHSLTFTLISNANVLKSA
jgi:hypothetical protein